MHAAVLRYFDHVARHGSIRKAADALSVASSAVNRQILRLEDEMGVALFERGRSGVRPTAAGELLLRHVRETQNEYQRTRAEIASLGGTVSGDVRIISLESMLVRFLPQVVDEVVGAPSQGDLHRPRGASQRNRRGAALGRQRLRRAVRRRPPSRRRRYRRVPDGGRRADATRPSAGRRASP